MRRPNSRAIARISALVSPASWRGLRAPRLVAGGHAQPMVAEVVGVVAVVDEGDALAPGHIVQLGEQLGLAPEAAVPGVGYIARIWFSLIHDM